MKLRTIALATMVATSTLFTFGCMSSSEARKSTASTPPKDGDIPVPADYQAWPKFVNTVEKSNGQIREIYINKIGMKANKGEAFPYGTITVMELYSSKKIGDKLAKDKLSKVFVMAKGRGWGQNLPAGSQPNGEWVYSAYKADTKTPATNDFSTCRGCHTPLKSDDFVARYQEHFDFKD